ncbi:hypothetical protein GDO78_021390 [Eleutherodactylus coqui]|uniref:Uncharacterized protein n=1 Tax=Eleutherodactylus coqui TaxID=57060 RepID=A0A8J6C1Y8_ELECQ|nr:hypothetical protein GDO78_021390 [Eleutherodactylus coqui]
MTEFPLLPSWLPCCGSRLDGLCKPPRSRCLTGFALEFPPADARNAARPGVLLAAPGRLSGDRTPAWTRVPVLPDPPACHAGVCSQHLPLQGQERPALLDTWRVQPPLE